MKEPTARAGLLNLGLSLAAVALSFALCFAFALASLVAGVVGLLGIGSVAGAFAAVAMFLLFWPVFLLFS